VKLLLTACVAVAASVGLVSCVGGTDPATNVTNVSAQLNAHGGRSTQATGFSAVQRRLTA
jgi:hypothetical protein